MSELEMMLRAEWDVDRMMGRVKAINSRLVDVTDPLDGYNLVRTYLTHIARECGIDLTK